MTVNSARRLVTFNFGEQPHRKDHKKSEEGNDILDAIVSKNMLGIESNGGNQGDQKRKAKFNFDRHRYTLPNPIHDMLVENDPATFVSVARAIS
jgi:hypothetical protein